MISRIRATERDRDVSKPRIFLQAMEKLQAVHAGHLQVGHDRARKRPRPRIIGTKKIERMLTVSRDDDLMLEAPFL